MKFDPLLSTITNYVINTEISSKEAYSTARACLADSMGCAILALQYPECRKLLGPVIPGTIVPKGSRLPGTGDILDPIRAAFNIGTMIRWLDYNDTWLAAEWGHPSDNLGGILAVADYLSRNGKTLRVKQLLTAMIKAHEIQGILALKNSFNRVGFDHVILVKVATTAVTTHLLGGTRDQIINALSNAFIDVGPLRTYRHSPNTGSRKSWAAGDATSRGVQFAMMSLQGEMGYPTVLTDSQWGLETVLFDGKPLILDQPLQSYVMENILFKISFPAEFHAQTAVECAFQLHSQIKESLYEITSIQIETHESAIRIIDKTGPLNNPADRDHCLQYMVAIGLIHGQLTADHYEQNVADDPRIDKLRKLIIVKEEHQFSKDYLDPKKRSIANRITIQLKNGTTIGPVTVEYPVGHQRRREEGIPLLYQKFKKNLSSHFTENRVSEIMDIFQESDQLDCIPVDEFINLFL